jgi:hypothetical protein
MKFDWMNCGSGYYRCSTTKPVRIKSFTQGLYKVVDMGYVMPKDGRYMACVYGSVNPTIPGEYFDNIDEAKAYVEEHALAGIAINKLTR